MRELRNEIEGKVDIFPHMTRDSKNDIWLVYFSINKSLLPGKMIHPMKLFCTIKLKLDKKEFYG